MATAVRVLRPVGTEIVQRLHWGADCPDCAGSGQPGWHNAIGAVLASSDVPWDPLLLDGLGPDVEDEHPWPTACAHCGAATPPDASRQRFQMLVLVAPDGTRHAVTGGMGTRIPGDMWPVPCFAGSACTWDNCTGVHWQLTLPDRSVWDMSSRASNCDRRSERTHRCWVLHGEPPHTADKQGHTCGAGGGSILTGRWHGHLAHGVLTP